MKDIYLIWVKLKNRKTELIQWVKVSFCKIYGDICSCNIRSSQKHNHIILSRSFQLKLFAREGKKELLNSFIAD